MVEKAPKINVDKDLDDKLFSVSLLNTLPIVTKCQREYLYWDKVKYLNDKILSPKKIWSIIKLARFIHTKNVKIKEYKNKTLSVNYNINEYLQQKLHYLDFNFGAGLQKEQLLSDLDKQKYLNNAIMEESIFSSMIEGATTTRVKAKDMLRKDKKPKNKSEQMILNNYKTIQFISEHKENEVSLEKLFEIHRLVTENTLEKESIGVFRSNNEVHVMNEVTGEIVHTPPDYGKLRDLMVSFCDFFNNNSEKDFVHPIVKASILH